MYGETLTVNRQDKEPITLRAPSGLELPRLLYRLCQKWAHPWLAVGGPWGLIKEAVKTLNPLNDKNSHEWIIANHENKMVGMVMLDTIDHRERTARLSYAIFPEFQRQGYASNAARFVVAYGYGMLKLSQIWTRVLRENSGSNKILDHLGFQRDPDKSNQYTEKGVVYEQDYGIIPRPRV
jgi:RimJ/RimL family protein N-acetyltransferase